MQIRRPLAATVLVAVMVSGCASPPVVRPTASPVPTTTPVFASEAEALEAAREAYAAYQKALSSVEPSDHQLESLQTYATESQLATERASFADLKEAGRSISGSLELTQSKLQSFKANGEVTIYGCLDVEDLRILDRSGTDVTPPNRPTNGTYEIRFQPSAPKQLPLLVDRVSPWSGQTIC